MWQKGVHRNKQNQNKLRVKMGRKGRKACNERKCQEKEIQLSEEMLSAGKHTQKEMRQAFNLSPQILLYVTNAGK